MKKIFLLFLLFLPYWLFAQPDSTEVTIKLPDDPDVRILSRYVGVDLFKLVAYGTPDENSVYNLMIKEFKKGQVVETDTLLQFGDIGRIMKMGDKKVTIPDHRKYACLGKDRDSLLIQFTGKYEHGKYHLTITYPGLIFPRKFKGKRNYHFRRVHPTNNERFNIPYNKAFPVLVYAPAPEKVAEGYQFQRTDAENVEKWYSAYNLKHYYVIYLLLQYSSDI